MKPLISLIALAMPLAAAQAQSSVTIYGVFDLAISTTKSGTGTTTPGGSTPVALPSQTLRRLDTGVGRGSRWGFRGVEDLGGGLKANFVLEGGFAGDTGALGQGGLAFGRQAWVGLSSGGFTVSAGRQNSPLDNLFFLTSAGGKDNWGQPSASSGHGVFQAVGNLPGAHTVRVNNSVLTTYTASGITAKLMVSAGDETSRGTGRVINPSLGYISGPWSVHGSYLRIRQVETAINATASPEWLTEWLVGGSYDFGFVKLFSAHYRFDGPSNPANLSPASLASFTWESTRSTWLGGTIPAGPGMLGLQATRTQYDYRSGPDGKSTAFQVFYEYPFSRRTQLYATYGRVTNDAFARTQLGGVIATVALNGFGADPSAYSLGLRHSF